MQVLAACAGLTLIPVREATSLFDRPRQATSGSLASQTSPVLGSLQLSSARAVGCLHRAEGLDGICLSFITTLEAISPVELALNIVTGILAYQVCIMLSAFLGCLLGEIRCKALSLCSR